MRRQWGLIWGVPSVPFLCSLVLLFGIYATYVWFAAFWLGSDLNDSCTHKFLMQLYVLLSVICITLTAILGCIVGFNAGHDHPLFTFLALLIDLMTLGMIGWGAYLWVSASASCVASASGLQFHQGYNFLLTSWYFWIIHMVLLLLLVHCLACCKYQAKHIQRASLSSTPIMPNQANPNAGDLEKGEKPESEQNEAKDKGVDSDRDRDRDRDKARASDEEQHAEKESILSRVEEEKEDVSRTEGQAAPSIELSQLAVDISRNS